VSVVAAAASGHAAAYDVLVGLHVVCVVVGFGAVAVTGAYGAIARRTDVPGRAGDSTEEVRRYFSSRSPAEYLVAIGPAFGVAAMAVRPAGPEFGQIWALAGVAIWLVAAGLLVGVVRPSEADIRAGADGDGGPAGVVAGGRRLMWAAATSDLLFVVALLLMVTQPG
jgi:hypothetical protein